mgnify:CR=1 FL=1
MLSITAEFARQLTPYLQAPRWLVAYSGGVDSSVLLHLAVQFSKQCSGPPVAALHIHHGLSSQADGWQTHCQMQCEALGVAFYTENIRVENTGKGLEAAARTARYANFSQHLAAGELLLQGHHQNDQAETVLFRLFRSAGVKGLSGIAPRRNLGEAQLLRPCLNVGRDAIEAYAAAHTLESIHDESNDDISFDRNYMRHEILPVITKRWPQAIKTISASAAHSAEAAALIDDLAAIDLAAICESDEVLNLSRLLVLPQRRQTNALKFWLAEKGGQPNAAQLNQIKQQFLGGDVAATPEIKIGEWQLNRYNGCLYCEPQYDFSKMSALNDQVWDITEPLKLAEHVFLSAKPVSFGGLSAGAELALNFDRSGVRFHPSGRGHSNSLKKLMQEYKILPWHRKAIPQLCVNGELAAVPGVGVSANFKANSAQQSYCICLTIGRHSYLCE